MIYYGTENNSLSHGQKRLIVIVNTLAFLTACLCLIISTVFWWTAHQILISGVGLIEAVLYFLAIVFNRFRKYDLALSLVIVVQGASAMYFGLLLGAIVNMECLGVFLAAVIFLLVKSPIFKWATLSLIILMTVVLKIVTSQKLITPIILDSTSQDLAYWFSFIAVLTMNGTVIYFYKRAASRSDAESEILIAERTAELARANMFKTVYLNETSHDYRGKLFPLSAITHELTLQWEEKGRPAEIPISDQILTTLNACAKNMLDITSDVLDVAKIEAGKFDQPVLATFNLKSWLYSVIEIYRMTARENKIEIDIKVEGKLPENIVSDEALLSRILSNLLANAIKFSPKRGTIDLHISFFNNILQISVRDSGTGIHESQHEAIFDLFNTSSATGKGTGLGLPIAKRITTSLNGNLWLNSSIGKGSTFTFQIPAIEVNNPGVAIKTNFQSFLGSNVLCIDDDQTNLLALSLQIKRFGCNCYVAEGAAIAMEILSKIEMDLIIADVNMPKVTGIELIQRVRENIKLKHIPFILVSGGLEDLSLDDIHADGYLDKPSSINKTYEVIAPLLSKARIKIRS